VILRIYYRPIIEKYFFPRGIRFRLEKTGKGSNGNLAWEGKKVTFGGL